MTKADHRKRNGHTSALFWFTGLSGSGKSTLAGAFEEALCAQGVHTYLLDGDNVRHGLNRDLGFSDADREENIRRIGEVAKLFVDAGIVTLSAFISPFRADRDRVRALLEPGEFVEVYVKADLATCEARDPKGLYRKARTSERLQSLRASPARSRNRRLRNWWSCTCRAPSLTRKARARSEMARNQAFGHRMERDHPGFLLDPHG